MAEAVKQDSQIKVAVASFIGTTLEWFDFYIYGTMAAIAFPTLFFPEMDQLAGILASFIVLFVGFLGRPIGGVICGHFGDRVGRKKMLVLTMLVMGVCTVLIGCIPTYQQIGFAAPVILTILRLGQGLALGGEWGGAALMTVEHAPEGKRGWYGSWCQMGAGAGLVLSTLIIGLVSRLSGDAFLSYGWRLPFLFSVFIFIIGMVIRTRITETGTFEEMKKDNAIVKLPIVEVFRTQSRSVILATGICALNNVNVYIVVYFAVAYGTLIGIARQALLDNLLILFILFVFFMGFFGWLSDKVGRRKLVYFSIAGTVLGAFPFWMIVNTKDPTYILLAMIYMLFFHSALYGPQAAFFCEMFTPEVRYTGASLGTNLATAIFGGSAPMIATALYGYYNSTTPVAIYLICIAALCFTCVTLFGTEPSKRDIGYKRKENTDISG